MNDSRVVIDAIFLVASKNQGLNLGPILWTIKSSGLALAHKELDMVSGKRKGQILKGHVSRKL